MFKVLFVCTGNRCRSPVAELLLARDRSGLPVEVSSAGLLDLGPVGAPSEMIRAGQTVGVDLSEHRARPLGSVKVNEMDLVIGFERSHVAAAVVEAGAPYERSFTLPELVRLLEGIEYSAGADPVASARDAVRRAHEARAPSEFVPGEDLDDPFGGPQRGYQDAARRIQDLTARLLAGLTGSPATEAAVAKGQDLTENHRSGS
jgi:protein-tyrosine phosphatase